MFIFKGGKKNLISDIEPHEVLLDRLAKKREKELGISEKKFEVPILRSLKFFLYFSIATFLILLARSFQLQVIEANNFSTLAQNNKYIFYKIKAQRGVIYDRNLKQLVFNKEIFSLACNKEMLPRENGERQKILEEVAKILDVETEKLTAEIEKNESPFVILSRLDQKKLIILETKIEQLPGFQIMSEPVREYLDGEYFSHIIGYVGKITKEEFKEEKDFYSIFDYVGRSGIEAYYEKILRKIPGQLRAERNALGHLISKEIISLPHSGKSLILSIDYFLQKQIQELLEKRVKELGIKKAAAVALNPRNGEILALVSLPTFDNNIFFTQEREKITDLFQDKNQPFYNRAISGEYLIGSIIKPIIASAALEEEITSYSKKIDCQGQIVIPNPWNPAFPTIKKDWKAHGITDLRKALAESCNVYFYTISGGLKDKTGLGVEKIKKYLKLFGFGEKTGVDLFGEGDGFIPDPEWKIKKINEPWRDGDTLNLSIGQGFISATPLQVATAFSAIANNGKLFQPYLVQKIVDPTNPELVIEEFKPKIIRENFIKEKNLQVIREGMRQAVTGYNAPNATAILLNSLPVSCAAKTGTAEVLVEGEKRHNSWITVFAPYENPEIVLTIVIEGVATREVESQLIVVPVAKNILELYFSQDISK